MLSDTEPRLVLRDVSKRFGDFWVLNKIRFGVPAGKVTAIIGPNGAGKTTLLHVISGYLRPDSGQVSFKGRDITGLPAFKVARRGIGRLFQDIRVFPGLSVLENVVVGMLPKSSRDAWYVFSPRGRKGRIQSLEVEAMHWLEYVGLQDHRHLLAGQLSFGQRKLLALARLFAKDFELMLLDEPTAGLSHEMVEKATDLIRRVVTEFELTVVMIEHNMTVVADLAYWIHFLHEGRIAFTGQREHVLRNQSVREIYMGL